MGNFQRGFKRQSALKLFSIILDYHDLNIFHTCENCVQNLKIRHTFQGTYMKKFIFIRTNACQHKIHEMIWHNIKAACRTKILFAYREKNHIHNCHVWESERICIFGRKRSEGWRLQRKNTVNIMWIKAMTFHQNNAAICIRKRVRKLLSHVI